MRRLVLQIAAATLVVGLASCSRSFPGVEPSPLLQDRFACVDIDLMRQDRVSIQDTTLGRRNAMTGSCGGDRAPEAVYLWTVPAAGVWRIETTGSELDTVLYIFNAGCSADELVCNDGGPSINLTPSVIDVRADAGAQLVIVVDGSQPSVGGMFQLSITRVSSEGDAP